MHIKLKTFQFALLLRVKIFQLLIIKINDFSLGAYINQSDENQVADLTIIASGSEVALAINAAVELKRNTTLILKVISIVLTKLVSWAR